MNVGPMNDEKRAILGAIIGAAVFASLYWGGSVAWFSLAGTDRFVAIEHIDVQAANETQHTVDITYESQGEYPVRAEITLYRTVKNTSVDKSVQSWSREGFLEPGKQTITLQLELSDKPPPGTYYYEISVTLHPGYNVERQFGTRSDAFPLNQSADASADGE